MIRRLQIPYYKRVKVWQIFDRFVKPESFPSLDRYWEVHKKVFGKYGKHGKRGEAVQEKLPDFLNEQNVAVASYFGSQEVFEDGEPVEIKKPEVRIKNFITYLDEEVHPDVALLVADLITEDDIGRYYDTSGRVYLIGYNENQLFVRLPINSNNPSRRQGPEITLPNVGERLILMRRGMFYFYTVQAVAITSAHRKVTGVIDVVKNA